MSIEVLERRFGEIGAHVRVPAAPWHGEPRVNVVGNRFTVGFGRGGAPVELEVVDVSRPDRHLLLLARVGGEKSKFLCGHDERHWFVAAVPEDARGVTGVAAAKAALQPELVQTAVERKRPKDRFRRRNEAYVRQGEWFFVPAPDLRVDGPVFRNEPLIRNGGGTPHVLEHAFRRGGRTVYVRGDGAVRGQAQYDRMEARERRNWRPMTADPELYARGAVRHPDHATVTLGSWHRVLMNTEPRAWGSQFVTFYD